MVSSSYQQGGNVTQFLVVFRLQQERLHLSSRFVASGIHKPKQFVANPHSSPANIPPAQAASAITPQLLAQGLAAAGDEVHLWAPQCQEPTPKPEGFVVHRLPGLFGRTARRELDAALKANPGRLLRTICPPYVRTQGDECALLRLAFSPPPPRTMGYVSRSGVSDLLETASPSQRVGMRQSPDGLTGRAGGRRHLRFRPDLGVAAPPPGSLCQTDHLAARL